MPNPVGQLTLSELREQIKREARLKGSNDLDEFITELINELLRSYTQNNRYFEFLKLNVPIVTVVGTGTYALPIDYQHLQTVAFVDTQNVKRVLHERNGFLGAPSGSRPRYYELAGNTFNILPYTDVQDNETIYLDYYAVPDKLDGETDLFPLPRLIPALKQTAIYRALLYNQDLQTAAAMKSDGQESESKSKFTSPNG